MTQRDPPRKAVVIVPRREGHRGPFFLAECEGLQVTVSLSRDVWQEESEPEGGTFVLLEDIRLKRGGWRAHRARFYRPSDEKPKGESPE